MSALVKRYQKVDGAGQRTLQSTMLNAVLVLMLATSILGPLLTEGFAPGMLDKAIQPC